MTVLERLQAAGAADEEAQHAAAAIAAIMRDGRSVVITDEVLEAARQGDRVLLAMLLAEEVEPDPWELAALKELDENPELRQTISLEEFKKTLLP